MKAVDLHRSATAEMIEAAQFYERRRHGVGFRFLERVEEACQRIGESPDAGSPLAAQIVGEQYRDFRTASCTESKSNACSYWRSCISGDDLGTGSGVGIGSPHLGLTEGEPPRLPSLQRTRLDRYRVATTVLDVFPDGASINDALRAPAPVIGQRRIRRSPHKPIQRTAGGAGRR